MTERALARRKNSANMTLPLLSYYQWICSPLCLRVTPSLLDVEELGSRVQKSRVHAELPATYQPPGSRSAGGRENPFICRKSANLSRSIGEYRGMRTEDGLLKDSFTQLPILKSEESPL